MPIIETTTFPCNIHKLEYQKHLANLKCHPFLSEFLYNFFQLFYKFSMDFCRYFHSTKFLYISIIILFIMENSKLENDIKLFYKDLINNKKDYLKLFSRLQIQIEGWFRGELMNYLDGNVHELTNKNREVPLCDDISYKEKLSNKKANEKRKVDLRLMLNGEDYWIELKHILVGYQIKTSISLGFYFSDNSYIANDIDKLPKVCHSDKIRHLYSLTFISTNYNREGDGNSRIKKIEAPEDLKNSLDCVFEKHSNLKDKISKISYDYNKELHFGYMLLEVKKDNDNKLI